MNRRDKNVLARTLRNVPAMSLQDFDDTRADCSQPRDADAQW